MTTTAEMFDNKIVWVWAGGLPYYDQDRKKHLIPSLPRRGDGLRRVMTFTSTVGRGKKKRTIFKLYDARQWGDSYPDTLEAFEFAEIYVGFEHA